MHLLIFVSFIVPCISLLTKNILETALRAWGRQWRSFAVYLWPSHQMKWLTMDTFVSNKGHTQWSGSILALILHTLWQGRVLTIPHPPCHSPHVSHHSAHVWNGVSDLGNGHRHDLISVSRLSFSIFTPNSEHPWVYFPGRLAWYRFFLVCIVQKCT